MRFRIAGLALAAAAMLMEPAAHAQVRQAGAPPATVDYGRRSYRPGEASLLPPVIELPGAAAPGAAPQVSADTVSFNADVGPSLAKRVEDLEQQLKKRDDADKKSEEKAAKKFVVRPFGRIHIDGVTFNQDAANKATVGNAPNGVDIRRARLGVEGEGFEILFYRFDVDFVTFDQATAQRPVIVDAYLDVMKLPVLGNVRLGHFREPFSLERLDSTHDLPLMERSAVVNTLSPFRNLGIMTFNNNEAETRTWAVGVFDENTNEFGEHVGDRVGYAVTGRTTWLPWYDEPSEGRYLLHFGASYSFRRIGDEIRRFSQTPEIQVKQGLLQRTPNFVDTGLLSISEYQVAGVESVLTLGSFSLQGEYLFTYAEQVGRPNPFFHGGYVEAMYWLTGENRNYNRKLGLHGAVTPHSNFFRVSTDRGIATGPGAWEVSARCSNLDLNSRTVRGGEMTNLALGLNWYYTVRSRVMFNYIHSFLDRNSLDSNADIFATRFQFAF